MKQQQLIPKRRRKRQPTAECMREQLRLAADEIIDLREQLAWLNAHAGPQVWRMRLPEELRPGGFLLVAPNLTRHAFPATRALCRLWHRIAARLRKDAP